MSGLFGSSNNVSQNNPIISSLQIQTSCFGRPIPWIFGRAKTSDNIIQYDDFTPVPHSGQSGGKGGSNRSSTTYTYTAALIMAICHGPIVRIANIWKGNDLVAPADSGLDIYLGSEFQNPYPYFTTAHPTKALAYRGVAYAAAGTYDLGSSASVPNHNYEVVMGGAIDGSVIPDVDIRDVIYALLTDKENGIGLDPSSVGDLTQFSNFCLANGLWVSPVYSDQTAAYDCIKSLLQIGFSDCFYSGGQLKIAPYSDIPMVGAYATYAPDIPIRYSLTSDDFIAPKDPIRITQVPLSERYNHVQVSFNDRTMHYNTNIAEAKDQGDIDVFGLRTMDPITLNEIKDPTVAQHVADFVLQRSLYVYNLYEFSLPWKYIRLEPMDVVELNYPQMGLYGVTVLISEIQEDENGLLSIKAEEYSYGVNKPSYKAPPTADSYTVNFGVAPGNALNPVVFEPPLQLTNGEPQIWLATAGGSNWGSCEVWASTDNDSFQRIGNVVAKCRYGNTSADIGSGAHIDTVNTLSVNISASGGTLISGTTQNAQDLVTRCFLQDATNGDEYLAYETATLTDVGEYDLTYLVRGAYGSDISSHPSGTPFVRIDENIFKYAYPRDWVGKTLYIKLVSINKYGSGKQDISGLTAHTHLVTGAPLGLVQNLHFIQPWVSVDAKIDWDLVPGADSYDIEVFTGSTLVRSVFGNKDNKYIYSHDDMLADGGPWRDIIFKVRARSITDTTGHFVTLAGNNPQVGVMTGSQMTSGVRTLFFKCDLPPDTDFAGMILWISTDATCPAIDANKIYDGQSVFVTLHNYTDGTQLVGDTTYYVRAAGYDLFGKDSLTIATPVSGAPYSTALDAGSITTSLIADGAVTLTKFASGLQPVELVSGLPDPGTWTGSSIVTNTIDGKLYRLVSGAWTAAVPTTDLTGTIETAQIAARAVTSAKLNIEIGGGNLLSNSSFEMVHGDYSVHGWNVYNNGAIPYTYTYPTGRTGGHAMGIRADDISTNTFGIYTYDGIVDEGVIGGVKGGWHPDIGYMISVYARKVNGAGWTDLGLYWNSGASPDYIEGISIPALSGEWQRYCWRVAWHTGVSTVQDNGKLLFSVGPLSTVSGDEIQFDDVQVEIGDYITAYAPRPDEILPRAVQENMLATAAVTASKIAAGAVGVLAIADGAVSAAKTTIAAIDPSSGDLVANSVTAVQIVAGTITAVQIAAGAIGADQIAANAITASKLGIVSYSSALNVDPNFTDPAVLHVDAAAVGYSSSGGPAALTYAYTSITGADTRAYAQQPIPIDSSRTYRLSAYIYADGSNDRGAYLLINFYDISGSQLSTSWGGTYSGYPWSGTPSTGWNQYFGLFGNGSSELIPSTAVYARIGFILNYGGSSSTVMAIQDMRLEEVIGSTLIKDGSITTDKIVAAAITSDKIVSGAVVAGKIAADAISATEIQAGAVTTAKLDALAVTTAKLDALAVTTAKISAGAITTDTIAANAITTDKITANAITTGTIAAGAITSTELAANAVTASKLAVVSLGSSLNRDPDFSDSASLQVLYGSLGFATTGGQVSQYYAYASGGAQAEAQTTELLPMDPTRTYRLSAYIDGDTGNDRLAYLFVNFYDDSGTRLSTSWGGTYSGYPWSGVVAVGWAQYIGIFGVGTANTIPSTANHCTIGFIINAGGSTGSTMAIQDFRLQEVIGSTLIKDGSITTDKIVTAAVTTDKIVSNAITTDKIVSNAVTADKIQANAVTAGKVDADAITSREIEAGSISASKLSISSIGSALNHDPNFTDSNNWTVTTGTLLYSGGAGGAAVAPTYAYAASGIETWAYGDEIISIDPSRTYRLSAQIYTDTGNDHVGYITIKFYDSSGADIGTSWGGTWSGYPWFGIPTSGNWYHYEGLFGAGQTNTIPSTVKYARIGCILNYRSSGSSSTIMAIQGLRIEEVIGSTLIKDGSITTDKIAAGAITADKITAGTITATEITTDTITAGNLRTGAATEFSLDTRTVTDGTDSNISFAVAHDGYVYINSQCIFNYTGTSTSGFSSLRISCNGSTKYLDISWHNSDKTVFLSAWLMIYLASGTYTATINAQTVNNVSISIGTNHSVDTSIFRSYR